MLQIDIEMPERWRDDPPHNTHLQPAEYFGEISTLFCKVEVSFEAICEYMQKHITENGLSEKPRRVFVGGMKARAILLASPFLKWYMDKEMVVADVQQVRVRRQRCFHSFEREVSNARRRGDGDQDKAVLAGLYKLIGSASYGSVLLNKLLNKQVKYVKGKIAASRCVDDLRFRDMCELDDNMFEAGIAKQKIILNLPTQIE